MATRLLGSIAAFLPRLHASQTRRLIAFSTFTWLQSINQILGNQIDRLLIASLLSTQALSYYVICTRIASLVQILPARATSFIFPLASEQHAAGQISRLRKTYFVAQNATIVLSLALAVPIFLYAPAILTIWLGENVAANATPLLRILVVTYTLLASSILPFYYLNGAGMPGLNAAFGWAGSTLNVAALVLLLPSLQVIGAAAAKLATHSLSLVCYPILHRRVLMDRRWYVGFLILLPPLIVFALLLPVVGRTLQPLSLAELAFAGCTTAALTSIVATPLVFLINPVLGTPFQAIVRQVCSNIFSKHRDS
jgi:O-antigen/teichoic acid export membrane protein